MIKGKVLHMPQVQTCDDCTSANKKSSWKRLMSYMCAQNHLPFLKHISVKMTNLLGSHFLYSTSIFPHDNSMPPISQNSVSHQNPLNLVAGKKN